MQTLSFCAFSRNICTETRNFLQIIQFILLFVVFGNEMIADIRSEFHPHSAQHTHTHNFSLGFNELYKTNSQLNSS